VTLSMTNAEAITNLDNVLDSCDTGSTNPNATLLIYDGTMPTNVDTALSGNTLSATLQMSNPAWGSASDDTPGATATANSITGAAVATTVSDATFFRILNRNNTPRIQGRIRATGDSDNGEELVLPTTNLIAGVTLDVTSLTANQPES